MHAASRAGHGWAGIATGVAAAIAVATPAVAQVAGVLGIDSQNRYRGLASDDAGPVLRASLLGDSPTGLYGGITGLWRTQDGALANADAIVGWSGRWAQFASLRTVEAGWGWDLAVHRRHYGESARFDFSELMAGLIGPGFSVRLWWSPSYVGQPYSSSYADFAATHDFGEHVRVFAHVGVIRYGETRGAPYGTPAHAGRTDGLAGASYSDGSWELRIVRDGLLSGEPFPGLSEAERAPGWVVSASVTF